MTSERPSADTRTRLDKLREMAERGTEHERAAALRILSRLAQDPRREGETADAYRGRFSDSWTGWAAYEDDLADLGITMHNGGHEARWSGRGDAPLAAMVRAVLANRGQTPRLPPEVRALPERSSENS